MSGCSCKRMTNKINIQKEKVEVLTRSSKSAISVSALNRRSRSYSYSPFHVS